MEKEAGATVRKALREQPQLGLPRTSSRPGGDDGRDCESDGDDERKPLYLRRSWSMSSA